MIRDVMALTGQVFMMRGGRKIEKGMPRAHHCISDWIKE
jgi:hypothetical protein